MTPHTAALLQQAIAAHRANRIDTAAKTYRTVLAADPENAVAHHNLGLIAWEAKQPEAALQGFIEAVRQAPAQADFAASLCEAARALNWPDAAVAALANAVAISPSSPVAHYAALAEGLARQGVGVDIALRHLGPVLNRTDRTPGDWHNLAYYLHRLGCHDAACSAIERSIAQATTPDDTTTRLAGLNLRAAILRVLCRGNEARQSLRDATTLAPGHAPSWNNLAALLRDIGEFSGAAEAAARALQLAPDYAQALNTAGTVAFATHDFQQARSCYERALQLQPDYVEAHWNLGLACLAEGDFARGWAAYEWRRRLPQAAPLFPDFGIPLWQGEALAGKTLLIHAEQGNGDTLQFVRLAEPLARRNVRIVALVQPGLVRLLRRCPFLDTVEALGGSIPAADFCLPILSLPHRLDLTLDAIPTTPYLFPDPEEIAAWRERLAAWPVPRIGLVWAGDPRPNDPDSSLIDRRRSLTFAALQPLLALPGLRFVSLQKGAAARQIEHRDNLFDPTANLHDFADTAALVSNLEAIVTVDTAVAHLAGALGRKTLLLSRYDACWRWLGNRPSSPWYPSLRVFAQPEPGNWASAIDAVRDTLAARA